MGDRVNQKNNTAHNIAGRDINNFARPVTPMSELIERYRAEVAADPAFKSIIEDLSFFLNPKDPDTLVTLEQKLKLAGRDTFLKEALRLKERARKVIEKHALSQVAQEILTYAIGEICQRFRFRVAPLIESGATVLEVDKAIHEEVLLPVFDRLEANVLRLFQADLEGFVYLLASNCHLRWD